MWVRCDLRKVVACDRGHRSEPSRFRPNANKRYLTATKAGSDLSCPIGLQDFLQRHPLTEFPVELRIIVLVVDDAVVVEMIAAHVGANPNEVSEDDSTT